MLLQIEGSNGFLITGTDREPVEVILQPTHFQVKLLNLDHTMEFCFYDYYRLSASIAYGLMLNWKAPEKYPTDKRILKEATIQPKKVVRRMGALEWLTIPVTAISYIAYSLYLLTPATLLILV